MNPERIPDVMRHLKELEAKGLASQASTSRPDPDKSLQQSSRPSLAAASLVGLAGDIVATIAPHTEADKAALLVQSLASFGSAIGLSAYFKVGRTTHYLKLFAVLVGDTSQGRKGTSWSEIASLFIEVDEGFADRIVNGLSTGEGLINHVRDRQTKASAVRKGGEIVGYEEEVLDTGASEKRVMVIESEFGRCLRVMGRDVTTLSNIIREAWDSDRLNVLTKNNPLKATGTHISLVGHVTGYELRKYLTDTEQASGFANRILWVLVRRSQLLPFGGTIPKTERSALVERLQEALEFAGTAGEIKLSEKAKRLWAKHYKRLSDGHPGMLGEITSRAAPQVLRMSSIYALMDLSATIRLGHLRAALALWKYCEDSATYIFGRSLGNRTAEKIQEFLSEHGELSRTDLNNLLGNNCPRKRLDEAMKLLMEAGQVQERVARGRGRSKTLYRLSDASSGWLDTTDESFWE